MQGTRRHSLETDVRREVEARASAEQTKLRKTVADREAEILTLHRAIDDLQSQCVLDMCFFPSLLITCI
jgi:hypothetical protein